MLTKQTNKFKVYNDMMMLSPN